MCILEKLNFPGEDAPKPSYCNRAFGARNYFCQTNSELLPLGLLVPMGNSQYNITYLNCTKDVSFLSRKGCTFRIIQMYILRTVDMRSVQA